MRRNLAFLAGAAAGTAVAFLASRRLRAPARLDEPDPRAEELRRKLAQARESAADEDDFEAAGMGAETLLEDEPPAEVDESRRRVHDRARAAAEEMRGGDGPGATAA